MKRNEILAFFAKKSGLSVTAVEKVEIGGCTFTRPFLIDLVSEIEAKTQKTLLADTNQPMAYLGEKITIGDIADYFSTNSLKITEIRKKIFKAPENPKLDEQVLRSKIACIYANNADVPMDDELPYRKVFDCIPKGMFSKDWDLPIFWTVDLLKENKIHRKGLSWITKDTTVGELIDELVKYQN